MLQGMTESHSPRQAENGQESRGRSLRQWAERPEQIEYTCGCGLYVNPAHPNFNPKDAIHIADCEWATAR